MTFFGLTFAFAYATSGFFFLTAFLGNQRFLRTLIASFPIGYCIWGTVTLLSAFFPFIPHNPYGYNLTASIGISLFLTAVFAIFAASKTDLNKRNLSTFAIYLIALLISYYLLTLLNVSILTADSLSHIHPQKGIATMANVRGFNATHAALAALAGQDRYHFAFHPLIAASLFLLTSEYIFHQITLRTQGRPILTTIISAIGSLFLASTLMAAINVFYVNNHTLVAMVIVLGISIMSDITDHPTSDPKPSASQLVISVTILSFLSLLRLEGTLMVILILITMLGQPFINRTTRIHAFCIAALLNIPFQLYLIFNTAGKVSSANFIIITAILLLLPLFYAINKPQFILHLQRQSHKYVLLTLLLAVSFFFYTDHSHMVRKTGWIIHNMFDESYWAFVHHTLFLSIPLLICTKWIYPDIWAQLKTPHVDRLLVLYIGSLLLILFMTKFHGTRPGWSSSQNRMLFHFLPIAVMWASVQIGIGIMGNKLVKSSN